MGLGEMDEVPPLLKYQRLGAAVRERLEQGGASASCVASSPKMMALGTHGGAVLLLDPTGNYLVKETRPHRGRVHAVVFDEGVEYVASCSGDGQVVVQGLYAPETVALAFERPMRAVALDPEFRLKKNKQIVVGGDAGELVLNAKGWMGAKNHVLFKGEGAIHSVKWTGFLVAWASDSGVRIWDTLSHQCTQRIHEPGPARGVGGCSEVFWHSEHFLISALSDSVMINRITGAAGAEMPSAAQSSPSTVSPRLAVQPVTAFTTDFLPAGIAPYGFDLLLLACPSGDSPSPEIVVVNSRNEELARDRLPIGDCAGATAASYSLACFYPVSAVEKTLNADMESLAKDPLRQWWVDGDEPQYFVVSPKDIIFGKQCEAQDKLSWLIEQGKYAAALEIIDSRTDVAPAVVEDVGQKYLVSLVDRGEFAEAAALLPKLLGGRVARWEEWVRKFVAFGRVAQVLDRIPTGDVRLHLSVYDACLKQLLEQDGKLFLATLQKWPPDVISVMSLVDAVKGREARGASAPELKEALAVLYILQGRRDLALEMYLTLGRPESFAYMAEYGLYFAVADKVGMLMRLDPEEALGVLVGHWEDLPPELVVPQLQAGSGEGWLHRYLHELFLKDANVGAHFHELQIELYARHDPGYLRAFLTNSNHYPLERAYEICEAHGLVKEMIFILGRMGNSKHALKLIIEKLEDIDQAVEFVKSQHDGDLWDLLISLSLSSPDLVAALLEQIGGYMDPLKLLRRIPEGMSIPQLRDRLIKIITDFRTQTSLIEGCNNILRSDKAALSDKLYNQAKQALPSDKVVITRSTRSRSFRLSM